MKVVNLKNSFISSQIYDIYSECMYRPTWEKFYTQAKLLINDDAVSILGGITNSDIIGVIAIRQMNSYSAEIKGIAVSPLYRQSGVGRQLIESIFQRMQIKILYAETDDDAISFYEHCGFRTETLVKIYEDIEYRRYKCILERS